LPARPHAKQEAYIARRNAKRHFYIDGWVVLKPVYDVIKR